MFYRQNFIRARVTVKGAIRWKHIGFEKGETVKLIKSYFVVHLIDESNVEIVAYVFDRNVTEFKKILQEGQMYTFSNFRVRPVPPLYQSYILHDHQIVFDDKTTVTAINEKCPKIPKFRECYKFTPIKDIAGMKDGDTVGE